MALKITVIGTGYLGATHAAAMAELGFEVLGLDIVPEKIAMSSRPPLKAGPASQHAGDSEGRIRPRGAKRALGHLIRDILVPEEGNGRYSCLALLAARSGICTSGAGAGILCL